jgi:dimethylhistidine N-methyltransferase
MNQAAVVKKSRVLKDDFYNHVLHGLTREQKKLHPKYFYDKQGSEFFDQICDLPEYYPYKTELALLPEVAESLSESLTSQYSLVEFGAGSLLKVQPLLDQVDGIKQFVPIDISGEHLSAACKTLSDQYEELSVTPVTGDFTQPLAIPTEKSLQPLGFFPGSTIGNLLPGEAKEFLESARATLGEDSYLLIGVDTKKSPNQLHKAYNDAQGVTAKFNLNILNRINRHFDADIDVAKFEHYAFYHAEKGCIEMHLVSLEDQTLVLDDVQVNFQRGESIHTESSYKYTPAQFKALAASAGWQVESQWLASDQLFSIYLLRNC